MSSVETIFQIFGYLHLTADVNEVSPIFDIAGGFADLPGWQRAILRIVPLVIASSPAAWDKGVNVMTDAQFQCVGRAPRFCLFGDKDTVDQLTLNEPAMLILADDDTFDSDILAAQKLHWQSVVLLAATAPRLRYMLHACGDFLWSIRSLSFGLKYSSDAQANFDAGEVRPRDIFQLSGANKQAELQHLSLDSLPLKLLSKIAPLLPGLQSVEMLVSSTQPYEHLMQKLQMQVGPCTLTSPVAHERGLFPPDGPDDALDCPSW